MGVPKLELVNEGKSSLASACRATTYHRELSGYDGAEWL